MFPRRPPLLKLTFSKLANSDAGGYPFLAAKLGQIGPGMAIRYLPGRGVHDTALFALLSLTQVVTRRHSRTPTAGGLPVQSNLRGLIMGAIPERGEWAATLSPLRGIDALTEGVTAFSNKPGPRRFARVPTHAIGVALEKRRYPRAKLSLPLRLVRVGEIAEAFPVTLVTRNISSSGIFFLAPRVLEVGLSVELEVALVDRPTGTGARSDGHRGAHRSGGGVRHAGLAWLRGNLRRFRPATRRRDPSAIQRLNASPRIVFFLPLRVSRNLGSDPRRR